MGQRTVVLPCIVSYEALKRAILTSQKVLSEEPDDHVPVKVPSVNSSMKTQAVPILIVRVPNRSCHSGLQWRAREKRHIFFFQYCFYSSSTWKLLTTTLHDL